MSDVVGQDRLCSQFAKNNRRYFSPEQKVAILREHI